MERFYLKVVCGQARQGVREALLRDEGGALARFLDIATETTYVVTLHAYRGGAELQARASSEVKLQGDAAAQVLVTKAWAGQLAASDVSTALVLELLPRVPLEALYRAVKGVYGPLLRTAAGVEAAAGTAKVQSLLSELEAGLKTLVSGPRLAVDGGAPRGDVFGSPLASVLTLADELALWTIGAAAGDPRAMALTKTFDKVRSPLADLPTAADGEALELLEAEGALARALEDAWLARVGDGDALTQDRMAHLLRLVENAVASAAEFRLRGIDAWGGPFPGPKVAARLRLSAGLLITWEHAVTKLWKVLTVNNIRIWKGDPPPAGALVAMRSQLESAIRLREGHEELLRLLGPQEATALGVAGALQAAHGALQPYQAGPATAATWAAAGAAYSARVAEAETRVAQRLKQRLGGELLPALATAVGEITGRGTAAVGQLLAALQAHAPLAARPQCAKALGEEMRAMRDSLEAYLVELANDLVRRNAAGKGASAAVENLIWARQTEIRALAVGALAAAYVGMEQPDSTGATVAARCSELINSVTSFAREQLKPWHTWAVKTATAVHDDGGDKTKKAAPLMRMGTDGVVHVYFSDDLVQLLAEERQLAALQYKVPEDVVIAADKARQTYRNAMVLKQVANFYSTIREQILEFQLPMLEAEAKAFEAAIQKPGVQWDNKAAMDQYIQELRKVTDVLMDRNRRLRQLHEVAAKGIKGLLAVDLVRNRDGWKKAGRELRQDVFEKAILEHFELKYMTGWKVHWDGRLAQVLAYQYRRGLAVLNDTLPPVEVSLVFAGKRAVYDPPLEKLREDHFAELRTFLDYPRAFKGFSDVVYPGFAQIADDQGPRVAALYDAAEGVFTRMASEAAALEPWVALGRVGPLDEFVAPRVTTLADCEANFRMLHEADKRIAKLPVMVAVARYRVSLQPLKDAAHNQIRDLRKALLDDLRLKAQDDVSRIKTFVAESTSLLEASPTSMEDIGKARKTALDLEARKGALVVLRSELVKKNALLGQLGTRLDLEALDDSWQTVTAKLAQNDAHMAEAAQQLRGKVTKDIEAYASKLNGFAAKWSAVKPKGTPEGNASHILGAISDKRAELEELKKEHATLQTNCDNFGVDLAEPALLAEVAADVEATQVAWQRYADFSGEREALAKTDWLSFRGRMYDLEDFVAKWAEKVKGMAPTDAVRAVVAKEIATLRNLLPVLKFVGGDAFTKRHWTNLLENYLGLRKVDEKNLTLNHLLSVAPNLLANAEKIKALAARAAGEDNLRSALDQLVVWGENRSFTLLAHETGGRATGVSIIKEWKELLTEVGDHQALVSSLKASEYFDAFKDEATLWEDRLSMLTDALAHLSAIQRKWLYLEPIFRRGALASEAVRFGKQDVAYRRIMADVASEKRVTSFADRRHLATELPYIGEQLDVCQKKLSDFLEEKRSEFPRFYFIGDDDVLEVLGQAKNPEVIQAHLKKLFAGIHTVAFAPEGGAITAMLSAEGERVALVPPVVITDAVEAWLAILATGMKATLANLIPTVLAQGDLRAHPAQLLCLAEQMHFTNRCEAAIPSNQMPVVHAEVLRKLAAYTMAIAAVDAGAPPCMALKVQALVLDLIHARDVADHLLAGKVTAVQEWAWARQLRYYKADGGGATVAMAESRFDYTWEYQGNAPKLVYTPLSDKCYLTLTLGMALGYGGNPYGPAGTGKTESVKALGQYLGRQVLVFNCDEQFDYRAMGRIFMGLVKCGAWGCFDEFNRLEEEVLSAVSQQIQVIQAALKAKERVLRFMDRDCVVDHAAAIFVTLNPAGKGYGGRSRLPDNLKQLFRSVAMSAPDNDLIAEVMLVAAGFTPATAAAVGPKLASVFVLARQLLAPQQHYDWGLRALKTVLGIAGALLTTARSGPSHDAIDERTLILRALRASTLPKLTHEDAGRFLALVGDVFEGASAVGDDADAGLEEAVKTALGEMNLAVVPAQVQKVLQLHLACTQRIGVIIVGPSGAGKSVLWRVLARAWGLLEPQRGAAGFRAPKLHLMNPKAIPRQQLLGHMDLDTREWFDGTLTRAAREVIREPAGQPSWIICDGDVDPEWIESLNSVLDDNRMLTLPNGERIKFGAGVNFIFESHNLTYASPATVSRAGMIFLSEQDINVGVILSTWCAQEQKATKGAPAQLEAWVGDAVPRLMDWVATKRQAVEATKVGVVFNALSHLQGLPPGATKGDFYAGLYRGLSANLEPEARTELGIEMGATSGLRNLGDVPSLPLSFEKLGKGEPVPGGSGAALVVVGEIQRTVALLAPWLERGEPILLVGPAGCGKALLLEHCFACLPGTAVATVTCSATTTSAHVLQKLVQMCGAPVATNTGRVLRPRGSDRLVLYLKDINLPRPDKYATSALVSFLQQLVTHHGFYDDSLEFIRLHNIHLVASMTPATTVGRHPVSTRLTSVVRVAAMAVPPREQLLKIVSTQLAAVFAAAKAPSGTAAAVAAAMLDVYDGVRAAFSPDDHRHYSFSPRELSIWVAGLKRYDGIATAAALLPAVAHEGARIFRDRLVGADATATFDALLYNALLKSHKWRPTPVPAEKLPPVFTTFAVTTEGTLPAGDIPSLSLMPGEDFKLLVAQKLVQYERENRELAMELFPEICARVARFDRALSQPLGSLLLCGRSGVGRRTTTALVAYMQRAEFVSPALIRGYDLKQFRAELRGWLEKCGVAGTRLVIYLEDHQLAAGPGLLECVNSLLAGGEVPGLYSANELELLLAPLKELHQAEGFEHPTLFAFFTARVRRNLRLVLSMDPTHPDFALRCEANPALYSRCALQWLDTWSPEGTRAVPAALLQAAFAASDDDLDDNAVEQICEVHRTAEVQFGATPRQFVAFVRLYEVIFCAKRAEQVGQQAHLRKGLEKLNEAAVQVDTLSKEAIVQKAALDVKQKQARDALTAITSDKATAQLRQREVEQLQGSVDKQRRIADGQKAAVEEQLAEVKPVLEEAKKAVGQIKNDHLVEIRSLKIPPDPIRDVLEGVMCLMGQGDLSWTNMKRFLGSRTVREDIVNFDAHGVTPQDRAAVEDLLVKKGSSFEHANIYRVSVAAAPLASWVKANVRYSKALEVVAPLEAELQGVESAIAKIESDVNRYLAEMKVLDDKVTALETEYEERRSEESALKYKLERATEQLAAAQTLLVRLAGERERWDAQARALETELKALPLNTIMAAAFATYLPSAPEDVRRSMSSVWAAYLKDQAGGAGDDGGSTALARLKARTGAARKAAGGGLAQASAWVTSWEFDLRRFMSSESEMLTWKAEGLPSDALSMENAIIILHGRQTPLVVDPSSAAAAWLRRHLEATVANKSLIDETTLHAPRFANQLENAVRFGRVLVVHEVDRIEPFMYPVLRRDVARIGTRLTVTLGDKTVDWDDKFRLYLVTRNPQPNVPPDAAALLAVTNFTVTRSGLEAQLLGLTLVKEKPELEAKKSDLLQKQEKLKVELAGLEKTLLETLAKSEGNILENKALINSLEGIKAKASVAAAALGDSLTLAAALDAERDGYRPIAATGASLYFLVRDMRTVNHMYQFSLAAFAELFARALQQPGTGGAGGAAGLDAVGLRIAALGDALLKLVIPYIMRSLFKDDRVTFGMHVARWLNPAAVQPTAWAHFLGQLVADAASPQPGRSASISFGSAPGWLTPSQMGPYAALATALPDVISATQVATSPAWASWASTEQCEAAYPSSGGATGRTFEQLVVTQALRPDRLESAMTAWAAATLRTPASLPPLSLGTVHGRESHASQPILFILTPGADPTAELAELAARTPGVGRARLRELAMGQGQSVEALRLLATCAASGDWLVLKNLHLVVAWLPTLEKAIHEQLAGSQGPEPRFRLWLTSEPHPKFPPTLLEGCLKITVEAPPGVKRNVLRTYEGWDDAYVASGGGQRASLLFVLAWFHAVVQERRRYLPQGWSKFYEFSYADLRAAADVLTLAAGRPTLDWGQLRALLESAIYGGRVDNSYDARVLRCYLREYVRPEALVGRVDLGGATPPRSMDRGEHMAAAAKLAEADAPAVFGLPPNIDRSAQQAASARAIAQLRAMAAVTAAAAGFDRERWATQLGPLLRLWDKVMRPLPFGREALVAATAGAEIRPTAPVDDFVALERHHGRRVVARVDASLRPLQQCLTGGGLLTPDIAADGTALIAGGIPASWESVWDGPGEPMDYLRAVGAKLAAIEGLYGGARGQPLIADGRRLEIDLAWFYHPDTFLNALRQQTARRCAVPMNQLALATAWGSAAGGGNTPAGDPTGLPIIVKGLLIQGAVFRDSALGECEPDAPAFAPVAPCVFGWVPAARLATGPQLPTPLYVGADRATLLAEVLLPLAQEGDRTKWTLASIAFVLGS